METGIHVGNKREKGEYQGIAEALLSLMQSGAEQDTIRCAIRAFAELGEVKQVNVSHSNVIGGSPTVRHDHYTANVDLGDAIQKAVERAAWSKPNDTSGYPKEGTNEEKAWYLRKESEAFREADED